jgi:hypothetical protein
MPPIQNQKNNIVVFMCVNLRAREGSRIYFALLRHGVEKYNESLKNVEKTRFVFV